MTGAGARVPRFDPPAQGAVDLLVIAGEHSGDEHAARMIAGFRAARPGCRVAALGGPCLADAGAQLLHDMTGTSVVGMGPVLRNYLSYFRPLMIETLRWITEHRPAAVCFVDYPGMNLRIASELRKRGLTVKGGGKIRALYYISPQIWAWKARRRFSMARDLDSMAVIFPFEPACYADTDLPVSFVGHPFVDEAYRTPVAYDPKGPILLLPGSRPQAVRNIFPTLLQGYAEYLKAGADHESVVLYPSRDILAVLRSFNPPSRVRLEPAGAPVAAAAVLTSSGTMSMHCALAGIPGAIVYRTDALTYLLARWLARVSYLGIANLLLREPMYPEYIQGAATPAALAAELSDCISDPGRRQRTVEQAARLHAVLEQPASGTACDWLSRNVPALPQ